MASFLNEANTEQFTGLLKTLHFGQMPYIRMATNSYAKDAKPLSPFFFIPQPNQIISIYVTRLHMSDWRLHSNFMKVGLCIFNYYYFTIHTARLLLWFSKYSDGCDMHQASDTRQQASWNIIEQKSRKQTWSNKKSYKNCQELKLLLSLIKHHAVKAHDCPPRWTNGFQLPRTAGVSFFAITSESPPGLLHNGHHRLFSTV